MRVAFAAALFLGTFAACDQLNQPMAVPNGHINAPGGTSASSSGNAGLDAGSDALAPLPGATQPVVTPQPGDTQL